MSKSRKNVTPTNKNAIIRTRTDRNGRVRTETARRDSGAFDVAVSTDARNNSTRVFIDSYGRAGQFGYGPSIELTGSEALTLFRALKRHYESTGKDSALYT